MSDAAFEVTVGHCIDVMRSMPDESVACCVTSPPYWGLRAYGTAPQVWGGIADCVHGWNDTSYTDTRLIDTTAGSKQRSNNGATGWRDRPRQNQTCSLCGAWSGELGLEPTPELFIEHLVSVFREVRRILKSDGTLWVNIGDSYAANRGYQVPDGKYKDVGNDKASRVPAGLKPKDLVGIPWMLAFALRADGWWLRQDIIWSKPNPMPESVRDRCTKSHEYLFLLSKSERYHYDADAIKEYSVTNDPRRPYTSDGAWEMDGRHDDQKHGGEPRSFNGSSFVRGKTGIRQLNRASAKPRTSGNKTHKYVTEYEASATEVPWEMRNKRSVWSISTQPTPDAHFATYPVELAETCILAGCPVGEITFDPFSGSGTTGLAAIKHGRRYRGAELNPAYVKITSDRTERHAPLFA